MSNFYIKVSAKCKNRHLRTGGAVTKIRITSNINLSSIKNIEETSIKYLMREKIPLGSFIALDSAQQTMSTCSLNDNLKMAGCS
jgi:hypothetical protein